MDREEDVGRASLFVTVEGWAQERKGALRHHSNAEFARRKAGLVAPVRQKSKGKTKWEGGERRREATHLRRKEGKGALS